MAFDADEIAEIQAIVRQQPKPIALDGVIANGSWRGDEGTVEVILGATAAIPNELGSTPVSFPRFQLMTPAVGEQTGPLGGERCMLIPRESGWYVVIEHGTDDAPNAAAGEYVKTHVPTGATMGFKNDNVAGDKAATFHVTGAAKHAMVTAGGIGRTADDSAETITDVAGPASTTLDKTHETITHTVGTATAKLDALAKQITHMVGTTGSTIDDALQKLTHQAGSSKILLDGAGNVASIVAASTGLGDLYGNLLAANNAVRSQDLQNAVNMLRTTARDDLQAFASAMVAATVPQAGAVFGLLATLSGVNVGSLASSGVRIK